MFRSRRLTRSAISPGLHVVATWNPSRRSRSAASTRYLRSRPTSSTRGQSGKGMDLLLVVTGCRASDRQVIARRDPDMSGFAGRKLQDRTGAALEAQAPRANGRGDGQDAQLAIEEHDVDREAHEA